LYGTAKTGQSLSLCPSAKYYYCYGSEIKLISADYETMNANWYSFLNTPHYRPLLSPLPSGFGLWNRVSNVVGQKEEKVQICTFLSYSALSLFSLSIFFALPRSFLLRVRERESADAHSAKKEFKM
jgi:hypothetical protein